MSTPLVARTWRISLSTSSHRDHHRHRRLHPRLLHLHLGKKKWLNRCAPLPWCLDTPHSTNLAWSSVLLDRASTILEEDMRPPKLLSTFLKHLEESHMPTVPSALITASTTTPLASPIQERGVGAALAPGKLTELTVTFPKERIIQFPSPNLNLVPPPPPPRWQFEGSQSTAQEADSATLLAEPT